VLGGTQSLHCNGRDEALALPTKESATIALRTQQVILHESGVANTADPAGGAYAIEVLTDGIETHASELLDRIDALGGTLAAIDAGYIQREIQEAAYRSQQRVDAGEDVVVGVHRYVDDAAGTAPSIDVFQIDAAIEEQQLARVREVRAGRSVSAWERAIRNVETAARDGSNLVPPIIEAVERHATLGEISAALRRVFGEHQESTFA
jgi:methylmalonyl-CoA mutase N-terminal domain/subunit